MHIWKNFILYVGWVDSLYTRENYFFGGYGQYVLYSSFEDMTLKKGKNEVALKCQFLILP